MTPFTEARLKREAEEKTWKYRRTIWWWKLQHLLFTGFIPGTWIRYYASPSQPRNNWPFAIWKRNRGWK